MHHGYTGSCSFLLSADRCKMLRNAVLGITAPTSLGKSEHKAALQPITCSSSFQSSWCLLGSWMNFQWSCFAFSVSNFCLHSGHWKEPPVLMPTLLMVPSPDLAASVISSVSGIA